MPVANIFWGLAQYGMSKANEAKTEEIARQQELNRPKIGRDVNADANLTLLKSELANGMSGRAEQAYKDINAANFSSTLGALLKGGGDVNSVGDIYGNSQEGAMKLAILKDSLRTNQIKNIIDQSNYVDSRNTITPFQVNEFAPWSDKTAANSTARMQAAKQGNDATQTILSSLQQYANDAKETKLLGIKTDVATPNSNEKWGTNAEPFNRKGLGFNVSPEGNIVNTEKITVQPTFKPTTVDQVVATSKRPSFLDTPAAGLGDYEKWKNIWNEVNFKKY